MPAIDGRRATRSEAKWRSYGDGFHDGVERCATRIAMFAEQLDGDVQRKLKAFARWLQAGQVHSNTSEADPLAATIRREADDKQAVCLVARTSMVSNNNRRVL